MNEEFTVHELRTIENALQVAFDYYGKASEEFAEVARALRAGESFPLFADGEAGAVAADRLKFGFDSQRDDCEALLDMLHDGVIVRGVFS